MKTISRSIPLLLVGIASLSFALWGATLFVRPPGWCTHNRPSQLCLQNGAVSFTYVPFGFANWTVAPIEWSKGLHHLGLGFSTTLVWPGRWDVYQLEVGLLLVALFFGTYPAAVTGTRRVRTKLRRLRGECTACGYNLTGNTSGLCPECGKPVTPVSSKSELPSR